MKPKQKELLKLIIKFYSETGFPPAVRDLRKKNISSGSVSYIVNQLKDSGHIRKEYRRRGKMSIYTVFFPVRDENDTYFPGEEPEILETKVCNGVTVTKCPPRYAAGFGVQSSLYEGIRI